MELLIVVREAAGGSVAQQVLPRVAQTLDVSAAASRGSSLTQARRATRQRRPLLAERLLRDVPRVQLLNRQAQVVHQLLCQRVELLLNKGFEVRVETRAVFTSGLDAL